MTALTLALACFVAPTPVEAPRPIEGIVLRYRFTPGEIVRYRVENQTMLLARKGELTEKNVSKSFSEHHYEVTAVERDGSARLRTAIDRVRMESTFNDRSPVTFDSDSSEPPAEQFRRIGDSVGRPMAELTVHPDGTAAEIRRLIEPKAGDAMNVATDPDGESVGVFTVFPSRPLRIGEEWSDTFKTRVSVTTRLTREVTLVRRYRLESVENGVANVAMRTVLLTPIDDPQLLVQLIQRQFTGTVRFDLAAGRVVGRTTEVDNTEIGWAGGDGSLRVVSHWNERLVAPGSQAVSSR